MTLTIVKKIIKTDILIIGAGIGGLTAACHATEAGLRTSLICKGKIAGGASFFPLKATLGIQVTKDHHDITLFKQDVMRVAMEMNDPALVDIYISESAEAIASLHNIGFSPWLRKDNRPACFARYARDIYLINDWAGARKKCRALLAEKKLLQIHENSYVVKIITENNQVQGTIIYQDNQFIYIQCAAIVLASGGVAGLYQHNLYPSDVIGSGHSLALDAGASMVNMEFIQFIPGITTPKYKTLFGEHTLKYCHSLYDAAGNDVFFQLSTKEKIRLFSERSNYAPFSCDFDSYLFDTTLQTYINQGQTDGLQIRFNDELYQDSGEFYIVYLNWLKQTVGIDLLTDVVKISPFAHSCNGGIKIDTDAQSQVIGLFAVGEVASAVEGANRLGGNSVGGALVFSRRAINKAKQYCGREGNLNLAQVQYYFDDFIGSFKQSSKYTEEYCLQQTRSLMMKYAGIVRHQAGLEQAIAKIDDMVTHYNPLISSFDLYYALRTAKLLLVAMHYRKESRGAHYRSDFPQLSPDSCLVEITQQSNSTVVKINNLEYKL